MDFDIEKMNDMMNIAINKLMIELLLEDSAEIIEKYR